MVISSKFHIFHISPRVGISGVVSPFFRPGFRSGSLLLKPARRLTRNRKLRCRMSLLVRITRGHSKIHTGITLNSWAAMAAAGRWPSDQPLMTEVAGITILAPILYIIDPVIR